MPVNITAAQGQALFDLAKLAVEVAADFGRGAADGAGLDSPAHLRRSSPFPSWASGWPRKGWKHRLKSSLSPSNGRAVSIVTLP